MTAEHQRTRDTWLADFRDELELRQVDETHIIDAVKTTHQHLAESEELPSSEFGDPREYAASLDLPTRSDGAGKAGPFLTILLAIASFVVFTTMVIPWINGGRSTSVIVWCLSGAFVLLITSIMLTVGIARHAIQTAIRDSFSGGTAQRWARWAPLAIATPWLFPVFAAFIVATSALKF